MSSETSLDDEAISSDDASAASARDVLELQQHILSQSAVIESFILNHQAKLKHNESFVVLESLFRLFQSEVSMNLAFRKAVAQERRLRKAAEEGAFDVVGFFKEFGRITHTEPNSFDDVYDFVIDRCEQFSATKQSLTSQLAESRSQAEQLKESLTAKDNELAALSEHVSKRGEGLRNLKSQLNKAVLENEELRSELLESNSIIEKQRIAIQQQKQAVTDAQTSAQVTESRHREELAQLNAELQIQRERYRSRISSLRGQAQSELESQRRQVQSHYDREIERYQHEVCCLSNAGTPLDVNDQVEGEFVSLTQQIAVLKEAVESEKKKVAYLHGSHQDTVAQNAALCRERDDLQAKIATLSNEVADIRVTASAKHRRYTERIRALKRKHKASMESFAATIDSNLLGKIRTIEDGHGNRDAELRALRQQVEAVNEELMLTTDKLHREQKRYKTTAQLGDELRTENERLRNMMRERTDLMRLNELIVAEHGRLAEMVGLDVGASAEAIRTRFTSKRHRDV
jgi:chromosome segregation ATPase